MAKVAKYELVHVKDVNDGELSVYDIKGLKNAWYVPTWGSPKQTFGGSAGLLKTNDYPGYCILCMTYHTPAKHDLPGPGYIVEFCPLYNHEGEMILIKYDCDETFVSVDRGYFVGETEHYATLTVYTHGPAVTFGIEEI